MCFQVEGVCWLSMISLSGDRCSYTVFPIGSLVNPPACKSSGSKIVITVAKIAVPILASNNKAKPKPKRDAANKEVPVRT